MSRTGSNPARASGRSTRWARRLIQGGFLLLFLYPLLPLVITRMTNSTLPVFTSWLLPFDPLLTGGQVVARRFAWVVIGTPLLLIALTAIFGRFFCGWICPMGTLLDAIQGLAFWRRKRRSVPQKGNLHLRYYILIAVIAGGVFSLRFLGLLDPLVIFQRLSTTLTLDSLALRDVTIRTWVGLISLMFLLLVSLELWQPRFWCRNLCPLGALLSLFSRFSLLNRKVTTACTGCGECGRVCPMRAIRHEAHDTDLSDCTFCLECDPACPKQGIRFELGNLAEKHWQKDEHPQVIPALRREGSYLPASKPAISRREFLGGMAAGVFGLVLAPINRLAGHKAVLRPPGALPEDEFLRTCIACQECVRICPTGALKPALLESGLSGLGSPILVPRQGGCALNTSCPNLCAKVCPVGALRPTTPADLKVGLAEVDRSLCLAWDQGAKCLVCVEACLNKAAIAYNGRVTVDPQKCTGCGRCESGCPVAGSAIHVRPL